MLSVLLALEGLGVLENGGSLPVLCTEESTQGNGVEAGAWAGAGSSLRDPASWVRNLGEHAGHTADAQKIRRGEHQGLGGLKFPGCRDLRCEWMNKSRCSGFGPGAEEGAFSRADVRIFKKRIQFNQPKFIRRGYCGPHSIQVLGTGPPGSLLLTFQRGRQQTSTQIHDTGNKGSEAKHKGTENRAETKGVGSPGSWMASSKGAMKSL